MQCRARGGAGLAQILTRPRLGKESSLIAHTLLFTESGGLEPRSARCSMRDALLFTEKKELELRSARCLMRDALLLTEGGGLECDLLGV